MDASPEPAAAEHGLGRRKKMWIASVIIFLALAAFVHAMSAPGNFPKGSTITISSGETLKNLSRELAAGGYVRGSVSFISFVTLFGGERDISPGDYYFATPRSVIGMAYQIARGEHDVMPIKITIPEGDTVQDISQILSQKMPDFQRAAFTAQATPLEGYLFPETYFFYPKTSPESVIGEMQIMFDKKTAPLFAAAGAAGVKYTKSNVVIMASFIEREARGDDDRAVISGILWKRLKLGMPLEVDATVAFANNIPEDALTKSDFSIDSPYNTYLHIGLPPAPIGNPGLAALTAALYPASTPYLYYLHDASGMIHYATTLKEHEANIVKYLK